jgi:hypothetical protein
MKNFCGKVVELGKDNDDEMSFPADSMVYFCGDVAAYRAKHPVQNIKIVSELSKNFDADGQIVTVGEVPINLHDVGVYFRNFFPESRDYFQELTTVHRFQNLTESNKPGKSFRKGIYLSRVRVRSENNETFFNLLRCSTNLDGPTENFRTVDDEIVEKVNGVARQFFVNPASFNHVLAQVYENSRQQVENKTKERKAKIKAHSDKTKDMPKNGLIAFCTFYDENDNQESIKADDTFDRVYKGGSVLTRLRFKLKDGVNREDMIKDFTVTLYPNSLFIISLKTNRLYTHEICPSSLPVDKIPTRLGYVVRCSNTIGIHRDGKTFISDQNCVELKKPTERDVMWLKDMYLKENMSDSVVEYGRVYFSLNQGDYEMPIA